MPEVKKVMIDDRNEALQASISAHRTKKDTN